MSEGRLADILGETKLIIDFIQTCLVRTSSSKMSESRVYGDDVWPSAWQEKPQAVKNTIWQVGNPVLIYGLIWYHRREIKETSYMRTLICRRFEIQLLQSLIGSLGVDGPNSGFHPFELGKQVATITNSGWLLFD